MGLIQDKMAAGGITPPGAPAAGPAPAPMAPPGQPAPGEAGEDPREEATETPDQEAAEPAPGGAGGGNGDIRPIVAAAMKALYESGAIEDAIGVIENAKFPAQGLSDVTFNLLSSIDEKAGGNIPEELFGPAASEILGMIVEDCQKLGLKVGGRDIALATQILLMRLLEEGGQDVSQMKAAMNQVDYNKVGQMIDQQMAQAKQPGAK